MGAHPHISPNIKTRRAFGILIKMETSENKVIIAQRAPIAAPPRRVIGVVKPPVPTTKKSIPMLIKKAIAPIAKALPIIFLIRPIIPRRMRTKIKLSMQ